MKTKYHIDLTKKALSEHFSSEALNTIITANIHQDRIKYQFGHDYIHFDGNAFSEGFEYINSQKLIIIESVSAEDYQAALRALGRMTHSWQDFYSHSNYVKLWCEKEKKSNPEDINFNDKEILTRSALKSGKNYGIIEFLAFIPMISNLVFPLMPEDSHARMNLDSPSSGKFFSFAYCAALKRTRHVYKQILLLLNRNDIATNKIRSFHNKSTVEVKV